MPKEERERERSPGTTVPDLVPSFYERDLENYKRKFTKSIEARMLDKIRMQKVHYQDFGRNRNKYNHFSAKALSMNNTKKVLPTA